MANVVGQEVIWGKLWTARCVVVVTKAPDWCCFPRLFHRISTASHRIGSHFVSIYSRGEYTSRNVRSTYLSAVGPYILLPREVSDLNDRKFPIESKLVQA